MRRKGAPTPDFLPSLSSLLSSFLSKAGIIRDLDFTREIVKPAYAILRREPGAQANQTSMLQGTRYKYYYQGLLIPTKCPSRYWGPLCGRFDSYDHMVRCYATNEQAAKGPDAIDILAKLAGRALTKNPGKPIPQDIAQQRNSK